MWDSTLTDYQRLSDTDDFISDTFSIGVANQKPSQLTVAGPIGSSLVVAKLLAKIQEQGGDDPDSWKKFTRPEALQETLNSIKKDVKDEFDATIEQIHSIQASDGVAGTVVSNERQFNVLERILNRESVAAGVLSYMGTQVKPAQFANLLTKSKDFVGIKPSIEFLASLDPRKSDIARAVISPIGIVHLFRQYFFEFDSFLGPSVQYLWLSPGGTVELIEVSTRKTIVERITEQAFESITKTEKSVMTQDEISDAIRQENNSSTKLGMSLNTSTSFSVDKLFTSQVSTGTSYDVDASEKEAREHTHKGLRQQTEKVSTELRQSFKSTFRTLTETTDTTSRRYVLQNNSPDKLMNYELRRSCSSQSPSPA